MKFSEKWLREWVNPPITSAELVEQLTMSGLEVESLTPVAGPFDNVVIGLVLEVTPHPDADRLRVCQVDIGDVEKLSIVCGATNVRAGLKVPVARIGAQIKEGFKIQATKLRGVLSQGMICSTSELGLSETSQGIMELPENAPVGKDFRDWLGLNDEIIDCHITPNRGDCLSIIGLAREIAVLNNLSLRSPAISAVAIDSNEQMAITTQEKQDCPRYVGRVIRAINSKAITPLWMVERLRRSGIRSIHPVVDITNYVMLELGQPLHAFDHAKIENEIIVRRAKEREKLTLLDGQSVDLDEKTLIIADKNKPLALAGIMGGLDSAVSTDTTDIFLEAAFFNPLVITGRARRYGLNTDSSYRFERGVDPQLPLLAIERVTQLITEITGGKVGPLSEITNKKELPQQIKINLRVARITKILGTSIPRNIIEDILQNLGMQLEPIQEGWRVTVPSYRFDCLLEEDLIEEIVRIYGYEKIPLQTQLAKIHFAPISEQHLSINRLRNLLVDRGYHEVITYSFVEKSLQQTLDPNHAPIALKNPLSAELAVMRTSLWPGLITSVQYNQNRQQNRLKFFETGLRFIQLNGQLQQVPMLAGVITESFLPEQWGGAKRSFDFYDLKGDLETLFSLTQQNHLFDFEQDTHPALHPGQTCKIKYADKNIGYMGALHPALVESLKLIGPVYLFELELAPLAQAGLSQYKPVSKYPAIRRDLSFWLPQDILVQNVLAKVQQTIGELLVDLCLFDVYQDQAEPSKLRSIALGFVLQHADRTLVESEVNAVVEKVIKMLQDSFNIQMRE